MAGAACLKTVTLKLPFLELVWDSDEREATALRNFTNQFRSRRAFEVNRSAITEHPLGFIRSVSEARSEVRKLLNSLPLKAKESRLVLLTVMDWLSEIDDKWFEATLYFDPNAKNFRDLDMTDMVQVMKATWPVIEVVRQRVEQLVGVLETQLRL